MNNDLTAFVANVHLHAGDKIYPIDVNLAGCLLACWGHDGVDLPEGISPEALVEEWNRQAGYTSIWDDGYKCRIHIYDDSAVTHLEANGLAFDDFCDDGTGDEIWVREEA